MWWAVLLLFVDDIDAKFIRHTIRSHSNQTDRCYIAGLRKNPKLRGRVVVRISISAGGIATEAKVVESEVASPQVEQCITNAITKWKFLRYENAEDVTINYPFEFSPSDHQGSRPHQLRPSDIERGMAAMRPLVEACGRQTKVEGTVDVNLVIAPTGRVASAWVMGKFAGTATAECVKQAVEGAELFAKFRGESMTDIDLPFKLTATRTP